MTLDSVFFSEEGNKLDEFKCDFEMTPEADLLGNWERCAFPSCASAGSAVLLAHSKTASVSS